MAKRDTYRVAHVGGGMAQGGEQRMKRAGITDLPKRRRRALGNARVRVGECVKQLIQRAPFANNAEHTDGLNPQIKVRAFGEIEQRPKRRLPDHAKRPGRAHPHVTVAIVEQFDQRRHRRLAKHAQGESCLGAGKFI